MVKMIHDCLMRADVKILKSGCLHKEKFVALKQLVYT
jgi:hypothetical protein